MTYFTRTIDKYFASWILKDTWFTDNPHDMDRFYLFVVAVHRLSKRVGRKPRSSDATERRGQRNPRTYDDAAFKRKILAAVERNHAGFQMEFAEDVATERTRAAMEILDCLAAADGMSFPSPTMQAWEPPLK